MGGWLCRRFEARGFSFFRSGAVRSWYVATARVLDEKIRKLRQLKNAHGQVSETLRVAGRLKEVGVPFFWLSAYEGEGDIAAWPPEEQQEFWDSGARFLPVHRMLESLRYLTKVCVCAVVAACLRTLRRFRSETQRRSRFPPIPYCLCGLDLRNTDRLLRPASLVSRCVCVRARCVCHRLRVFLPFLTPAASRALGRCQHTSVYSFVGRTCT